MGNYLLDLELFLYIYCLIEIGMGLFDWYRMDRFINHDLKVEYLTVAWSKILVGMIHALLIFLMFRFNIAERISERMPLSVFLIVSLMIGYFINQLIISLIKRVLPRIIY